MAIVTALNLFPVKSCRGIALDAARLGHAGLEADGVGDREWMVVDAATGVFLTQRQAPRMALIAPQIVAGRLTLCAPDMPKLALAEEGFPAGAPELEVTVWNHPCRAFDAGEPAAQWLSSFLGRALRLARFDPAHRRVSNRQWTGAFEALNRFSDGYPILMISEASLADLNERLASAGREALPMDRFRPNLVITGVSPYDEDHFESLHCEDVRLKPVKPCPRCPIPSIDQATGLIGDDPLDILARYRDDPRSGGVVFGQNVIVLAGIGATLRVGQVLQEEWNF